MVRSATDVMHEAILSAVLDAIDALRAASGGLQNSLLRQLNAIHANTTFADLPKELQDAINASVRETFTRLLKQGYSVSTASAAPARSHAPRPDSSGRPPPRGPRPERRPEDRNPRNRGPRGPGTGRPGGKPPRRPN